MNEKWRKRNPNCRKSCMIYLIKGLCSLKNKHNMDKEHDGTGEEDTKWKCKFNMEVSRGYTKQAVLLSVFHMLVIMYWLLCIEPMYKD